MAIPLVLRWSSLAIIALSVVLPTACSRRSSSKETELQRQVEELKRENQRLGQIAAQHSPSAAPSSSPPAVTGGANTKAVAGGEENKSNSEPLSLEQAHAAYQRRDFSAALGAIDKADRATPHQAAVLNLRGAILLELKWFDEAEAVFSELVKLDPSSSDARYSLANIVLKKKDYTKARERFEALLKRGDVLAPPELIKFKIFMSLLLGGKEAKAKKAIKDFERSDETAPSVYYAKAAWEYKHGNPKKASDWLRSAEELYPSAVFENFADDFYDLGWLERPPKTAERSSSAEFAKQAMGLREQELLKVEPQTFIPTTLRSETARFPWKTNIVATLFWIGEKTGKGGQKTQSAWDKNWMRDYGGPDEPRSSARRNYIPISFLPRQNPFYCALPYNDVSQGKFKEEAPLVIPWFKQAYTEAGQSVCQHRWVAIRKGARTCYAQWEDCGPFRTDHYQYVFQNERPKHDLKHGAGLCVAPAVRDYLGLAETDVTDWQFVDVRDVPPGPWRSYGENNHFVLAKRKMEQDMRSKP